MSEGSWRIAVVGATGLVGREVVEAIGERLAHGSDVLAFSSDRSEGEPVECGEDGVVAKRLGRELPEVDLAFLCAPSEVNASLAEELASQGAAVIDLAPESADVPVALADWNGSDVVPSICRGGIVTLPSPVTIVLGRPLRAIAGVAKILSLTGTALVPSGGFGRTDVERLSRETAALLGAREPEDESAERRLAFTSFPVGHAPGGRSQSAIRAELASFLGIPGAIRIDFVRTPVFHGLGGSVWLEVEETADADRLLAALREAPSVVVADPEGDVPGTLDAVGEDAVFVSGLEVDGASVHFWLAADHLRQAIALGAVALGELILRHRASH